MARIQKTMMFGLAMVAMASALSLDVAAKSTGTQKVKTSEGPSRIYAAAINGDEIADELNQIELKLILNNKKNRVGIDLSSCKDATTHEDSPICDHLRFAFSAARVEGDRVIVGGQTVAILGRGDVLQLNDRYRLGYEVTPRVIDDGFDVFDRYLIRVFVEPRGGQVASLDRKPVAPPAEEKKPTYDYSVEVSSGKKGKHSK